VRSGALTKPFCSLVSFLDPEQVLSGNDYNKNTVMPAKADNFFFSPHPFQFVALSLGRSGGRWH
jgi:hypothetical protein